MVVTKTLAASLAKNWTSAPGKLHQQSIRGNWHTVRAGVSRKACQEGVGEHDVRLGLLLWRQKSQHPVHQLRGVNITGCWRQSRKELSPLVVGEVVHLYQLGLDLPIRVLGQRSQESRDSVDGLLGLAREDIKILCELSSDALGPLLVQTKPGQVSSRAEEA